MNVSLTLKMIQNVQRVMELIPRSGCSYCSYCCVVFAAVHGAETPIATQPAHALYYTSNTLGQGE